MAGSGSAWKGFALPLSLVFLVASIGCGGASAGGAGPNSERGAEPGGPGKLPDDHPARAIVGATVYDVKGASKVCAAPEPNCPSTPRDVEFLDRCRLHGFQVRQCGCEQVCSGNVAQEKTHYDAQGKPRECSPEKPDCTPKETSASFQDGCTDAGHKLVVCGCEWMCSGPPRGRSPAP
jgi:hypothetical protein